MTLFLTIVSTFLGILAAFLLISALCNENEEEKYKELLFSNVFLVVALHFLIFGKLIGIEEMLTNLQ